MSENKWNSQLEWLNDSRDAGAVFGEIMGYERPLWFEPNSPKERNALLQGQDVLLGKPQWFERFILYY